MAEVEAARRAEDSARFAALLRFLGPDGRGGAAYASLRERLEDFFRWRGLAGADALADEVLDRVARRVDQGLDCDAPTAFVLGVARLVALEAGRRDARSAPFAADQHPAPPLLDALDRERAHSALDACLARLAPEDRRLLLAYHRGDGQDRIAGRARLAEALGVGLATLRVRVFRIRARVERCLTESGGMHRDPET